MASQALHFTGKVEGGRLPDRIREAIARVMRGMEGKKADITIKVAKKQRSGSQNRFYWGVIVPHVREMFEGHGTGLNENEVHEFLKKHVGKMTRNLRVRGEMVTITASSTELTTTEWEDYMTKIRAWAAEFGIALPLPNEESL